MSNYWVESGFVWIYFFVLSEYSINIHWETQREGRVGSLKSPDLCTSSKTVQQEL